MTANRITLEREDMLAILNWQCALDEALFSIVEGYGDIARAREAYRQVKAVREEIAGMLRIPNHEKETADAGTTEGAMGNAR